MKITRRTNVFVKTEREFVVRGLLPEELSSCGECAAPMIPGQAAADFFGVSSRRIYRFIESERIHFLETETNEIYVCPASVKRVLELNE
jgi:hypothetical protein